MGPERLVNEFSGGGTDAPVFWVLLPDAIRVSVALASLDLGKRILELAKSKAPRDSHTDVTGRALLAEAEGNLEQAVTLHREAAACWKGYGTVHEQAYALLGAGRCLVALGRPGEAASALEETKAIFSRLRAAPLQAEVEGLLAAAA